MIKTISKQKINLIHELSFYVLKEIEELNENNNKTKSNANYSTIMTLINVVKSSRHWQNKQIKTLIHDFKYQLPF